MSERGLQEAIQKANSAFIEQALERAAAAREEKKPKTITLSPLENAFATAETKDFSTEAMKQYRNIAKISDTGEQKPRHPWHTMTYDLFQALY